MTSRDGVSTLTGVLVVVVCGVLFVWFPRIMVLEVEVILGGAIAGYLRGDVEAGGTTGLLGGLALGGIWAVLALLGGDAVTAVVLLLLSAANATAGGLVGGWLAQGTGR